MKTDATLPKISNNILAIDTASPNLAVGINGIVDSWTSPNHHTESLVLKIDKLLKRAKLTPAKLGGVVFVTGPGSFTGLRVGATVANGIGFAQKIGLAGISQFELILKVYPKIDWVVLDGMRGEVFVQYRKQAPMVWPIAELAKRIKKGDRIYIDTPDLVAKVHSQLANAGTIVIGPMDQSAKLRLMMGVKVPKKYRQVLPMYLREANITAPKAKRGS
jgi:tRNA threonylcarbamoyl adenosine modification protein YeaZ